jgi:hypothetical protein
VLEVWSRSSERARHRRIERPTHRGEQQDRTDARADLEVPVGDVTVRHPITEEVEEQSERQRAKPRADERAAGSTGRNVKGDDQAASLIRRPHLVWSCSVRRSGEVELRVRSADGAVGSESHSLLCEGPLFRSFVHVSSERCRRPVVTLEQLGDLTTDPPEHCRNHEPGRNGKGKRQARPDDHPQPRAHVALTFCAGMNPPSRGGHRRLWGCLPFYRCQCSRDSCGRASRPESREARPQR